MREKLSLWLPTRSRSKAAAIATSSDKRAELFVTTKVWNDPLLPDALRLAFSVAKPKLEDRAAIAALPEDQRFVPPPFAPEWDAVV